MLSMSETLSKICGHLNKEHQEENISFIYFPFDVAKFCQENDEEIEKLKEEIELLKNMRGVRCD